MWQSTRRDDGTWRRTPLYTYLYSAGSGQTGDSYGTDVHWSEPPRELEAGRWYAIEQRVRLNIRAMVSSSVSKASTAWCPPSARA